MPFPPLVTGCYSHAGHDTSRRCTPRRARLHCGLLQAVFVVHIPAAMFSCLAPPLILTGVTRRLTLQSAPAALHRLPSLCVSTPSSLGSQTINTPKSPGRQTSSPNLAADIQAHPMSSAVAVSAGPSWRSNSMQQPRFKTILTRDGDMLQVIETWQQCSFTFSFGFPNLPRRRGTSRHSGRSQAHPTETGPSTQSSL